MASIFTHGSTNDSFNLTITFFSLRLGCCLSVGTIYYDSNMSQPLQVKVSRDGKEIGTYLATEAVRLLAYGTLKETDFYWHEGMTDWAPLAKLQEAEALRQSAEKARKAQEEEARKAEQLEQEKARAKQIEDWAVAEAVRRRLEKEKANNFQCHCCRESFKDPRGFGDMIGTGVAALLFGSVGNLIAIAIVTKEGGVGSLIFLSISSLVVLFGLGVVLASFIRSPHCPMCESTNFSRPEKQEEQK